MGLTGVYGGHAPRADCHAVAMRGANHPRRRKRRGAGPSREFAVDSPFMVRRDFTVRACKRNLNLWFLDVFSGMPHTVLGFVPRFANPKGIESFSPGLRGTRYPGCDDREITTLKELDFSHKPLIYNPFRVGILPCGNPA